MRSTDFSRLKGANKTDMWRMGSTEDGGNQKNLREAGLQSCLIRPELKTSPWWAMFFCLKFWVFMPSEQFR